VRNVTLTADSQLIVQDVPVIGMRKQYCISKSVYFTGVLSHHYTGKRPEFVFLTAICCFIYTVGTPCVATNTQAIFYLSPHVLEHALVYCSHRVTCGLSAAENEEESIVVQSGEL
jgi:hypothetical protein